MQQRNKNAASKRGVKRTVVEAAGIWARARPRREKRVVVDKRAARSVRLRRVKARSVRSVDQVWTNDGLRAPVYSFITLNGDVAFSTRMGRDCRAVVFHDDGVSTAYFGDATGTSVFIGEIHDEGRAIDWLVTP